MQQGETSFHRVLGKNGQPTLVRTSAHDVTPPHVVNVLHSDCEQELL